MSAELRVVTTGIEQYEAPKKTKDEYVKDFIKSMAALDESIKPFREQKTDLRKSYVDNNYLSKDEIKMALQAYRLVRNKVDIDQLDSFFEKVKAMNIVEEE